MKGRIAAEGRIEEGIPCGRLEDKPPLYLATCSWAFEKELKGRACCPQRAEIRKMDGCPFSDKLWGREGADFSLMSI